jgi:PKD repeat protein
MTLSNYPKNFDNNSNLYEVHDYLRVYLAEDYTPGDSVIYVYGDGEILTRFPDSDNGGGIITLTDQCDEIEKRAISFYYTTKTIISANSAYFSGIELLPGFTDVPKYKDITNITQNVMAEHHNCLKDAIINIEKFIGLKGEISRLPLEGTIEQRTNYLRYLVLAPKAWFSVNKKIGLNPSNVTFNDLSFRLGTDGTSRSIHHTWNFNTSSEILFSYYKSYSFEKLSSGEIKTKIKFSLDETTTSNDFLSPVESYVLQKSTDSWETYTEVGNSNEFTLTFSSVKQNPEYRFLLNSGGDNQDGLTIYINLGNDVINYTYFESGFYDVSLKVENDFGEDTVILRNVVNVREFCPSEAEVVYVKTESQLLFGDENNNRDSLIVSPTNIAVSIFVKQDEDGDLINGENALDPVNFYTWGIQDDLVHLNQGYTKALFSVGGIYDVVLRTDTESGNYRISKFKSNIDVIEKSNLWLWTSTKVGSALTLNGNEFGLISETFKTLESQAISDKNNSFLETISADPSCDCENLCCEKCYTYSEQCRKIREFDRNNGFAKIGNLGSGDKTTNGLIFWATGRNATDNPLNEKISFKEYNAFGDYYSEYGAALEGDVELSRQWGWVYFATDVDVYFLFGSKGLDLDTSSSLNNCKDKQSASSNSTYEVESVLHTLDINNQSFAACNTSSFKNGAEEILNYSAEEYSFYRSAWKDGSGYILSSVSGSEYFRIRNFYKTSGTVSDYISDITKINDMSGPAKSEGELVSLSSALYFFNNSGSISVFNTTTGVWTTGGPGVGSTAFKSLQDTNVDKFDDINQTLFASSDEDHNVYISYDYSPKSFIKFNDIDLTFRYLGQRPSSPAEKQWLSTIY